MTYDELPHERVKALELVAAGEFVFVNDRFTTYQSPEIQQKKAQAILDALGTKDPGDSWAQYDIWNQWWDSITVSSTLRGT